MTFGLLLYLPALIITFFGGDGHNQSSVTGIGISYNAWMLLISSNRFCFLHCAYPKTEAATGISRNRVDTANLL
ncbi:hypothetical protein PLANPX_3020 [Lacipirellula parvula]|uniref:Uncharacterized protein n=1 Tax=Lacipirellula parvula TaxID=2650471 RepID=A0A5K7XA23_9BACT|nr:hypothetical protein PLANPX_3020 [Lacipirellula parvula]